ncbi:hypothetical protein SAMN05660236_5878 [Ohtaekwangia koreensis]|uniref:Uncharacterized protein n=1 Tax=Ohtaekwangia koreensis TaxID=688867 RepID=A0A1T5MMT7_9BACT|nr:hypothetical protein SAMN05660236_5878 [Ohtaekwangia koreensis]
MTKRLSVVSYFMFVIKKPFHRNGFFISRSLYLYIYFQDESLIIQSLDPQLKNLC